MSALASLITLLTLSGCTTHLPVYPPLDAPSTLRILNDRAASIHTLSAMCQITLRDASGESITLDGALAAKNPGWLRLRAWKFSTAAFDLTLTPEGLWILTAEDAPTAARKAPAKFTAAQLAQAWMLFNGGFFANNPVQSSDPARPDSVIFQTADAASDTTMFCIVDRATLTPDEFIVRDGQGNAIHTLKLDRYRMINDIAWPHRISMEGEHGRVVIDVDDVQLNEELAPGAFNPPRRAVKQP